MRYIITLTIVFSLNLLKSQSDTFQNKDITRTSEFKRDVAYGQDCDDTEYRDYKGSPAWKGYGGWISECDSILTVNLDREFAERERIRKIKQAEKDSIDTQEALAEIDNLDLDAMWENTVWEEIQDVTTIYGEVEQITAVAGVRGAEAEDEALEHLYYRKSMRGIALIDLKKAYGKLHNKRKDITNPQELKKIDSYLNYLMRKIKKREA